MRAGASACLASLGELVHFFLGLAESFATAVSWALIFGPPYNFFCRSYQSSGNIARPWLARRGIVLSHDLKQYASPALEPM